MERRRVQVHSKVSLQPTEKEEVCFLFRGPDGLGIRRVHGGASLEEWYLFLHGRGSGGGVDGYFTTLGGRILIAGREVARLGLDGSQEVGFQWQAEGGAVQGWRQGRSAQHS